MSMDVKDLGTEAVAAAAKLAAPAFVLKDFDPSREPRMLMPQGVECALELGDQWRVAPSDALQPALEQVISAKELALEYEAGLA
jgi:hypothetical protein